MIGVVYYTTAVGLVAAIALERVPSRAFAYLLASHFLTLPIGLFGNSVNGGAFPSDGALLVYLLQFGRFHRRSDGVQSHARPGFDALVGLLCIAAVSGVVNYAYVQPEQMRFYAFTTAKFAEYAVLGWLGFTLPVTARRIESILKVLASSAIIYSGLHVAQLLGYLDLRAVEFIGPRASEMAAMNPGLFDSRDNFYLAAIKAAVAGNASMMAFLATIGFRRSRRLSDTLVFGAAFVASCASVFGTTSRSDIVGLLAGLSCIAVLNARNRFKTVLIVALSAWGVFAAFTMVWREEAAIASLERIEELWNAEALQRGSYADREYDQIALPQYFVTLPLEAFVGAGPGNFRRYQLAHVTKNAMGHNSYLHWLGELGLGGLFCLILWCAAVGRSFYRTARDQALRASDVHIVATAGLAMHLSRLVAGWGAESLFGTDAMGYCSMFYVATTAFLVRLCQVPAYRDRLPEVERRGAIQSRDRANRFHISGRTCGVAHANTYPGSHQVHHNPLDGEPAKDRYQACPSLS